MAGPFNTPPMAGFRANPLAVVVRNGKVRPILNMSRPKGPSFNDNVDKSKLERLHMGTAKQFGFSLMRAGKEARFSKFDLQDTYKLIPAKKKDFRLQGFSWLGKWFVETSSDLGGFLHHQTSIDWLKPKMWSSASKAAPLEARFTGPWMTLLVWLRPAAELWSSFPLP